MICIDTLILWAILVLGAWNLLGAIIGYFYKEPGVVRFSFSILFGIWAAVLLATTEVCR